MIFLQRMSPRWGLLEHLYFNPIPIMTSNDFDPICNEEGMCACGMNAAIIHCHLTSKEYEILVRWIFERLN